MAVTFEDYIYDCYNSIGGIITHFAPAYNTPGLNEVSPFRKYMRVDLSKDVIEVPCIYKSMIIKTLEEYVADNNKPNVVYIPMMCLKEDLTEVKSSNPLIKEFLHETSACHNLCKKKGSGTVYLGGKGIILYEDFTPLMMFTIKLRKVEGNAVIKYKYNPEEQLLRINPIIYSRDDLLAKYIRTKFLTNIFAMKVAPNYYELITWRTEHRQLISSPLFTTRNLFYDFKVLIEDFSDFFYTPSVPDVTFDNNEVNQLLLDNIEDILNHSVYDS